MASYNKNKKSVDLSSRVYSYGARPPTVNGDMVSDQMYFAHKYYNALIASHIDKQKKIRELLGTPEIREAVAVRKQLDAEIKAGQDEIKKKRSAGRTRTTDTLLREKVKALKDQRAIANATVIGLRSERRADAEVVQALEKIYSDHNATVKILYAEFGQPKSFAYWCTRNVVREAVDASIKAAKKASKDPNRKPKKVKEGCHPSDPSFRRWDGSGHLGLQIMGGITVADLFGDNPYIQIKPLPENAYTHPSRGERRRLARTVARIRIGSNEDRSPIFAEIPFIMHRPLPMNAEIKMVHLIREVVADKPRYSIQFGFNYPTPAQRTAGPIIGIDVGWRRIDGEIRIAYAVDSDGHRTELRLPQSFTSLFQKIDDLRSIRDKRKDIAYSTLREWVKTADTSAWFQEETASLPSWKSPRRLDRLVSKWREKENRFAGDDAIFTELVSWRKKERHLWQWEINLADQLSRYRTDIYRNFAARIAAKCSLVAVEDFDVRVFIKKAAAEDAASTEQSEEMHRRIGQAAIGSLRLCLESACSREGVKYVKLPPEYTTLRCHKCKQIDEDWNPAVALEHTCPNHSCGVTWDQDFNAAINLLDDASGKSVPSSPDPLASESVGKDEKKSNQVKRRAQKLNDEVAPLESSL